jgi:hypothetical protein
MRSSSWTFGLLPTPRAQAFIPKAPASNGSLIVARQLPVATLKFERYRARGASAKVLPGTAMVGAPPYVVRRARYPRLSGPGRRKTRDA